MADDARPEPGTYEHLVAWGRVLGGLAARTIALNLRNPRCPARGDKERELLARSAALQTFEVVMVGQGATGAEIVAALREAADQIEDGRAARHADLIRAEGAAPEGGTG